MTDINEDTDGRQRSVMDASAGSWSFAAATLSRDPLGT
jgi:hypothetical protein